MTAGWLDKRSIEGVRPLVRIPDADSAGRESRHVPASTRHASIPALIPPTVEAPLL
jgi:hypothetical protein